MSLVTLLVVLGPVVAAVALCSMLDKLCFVSALLREVMFERIAR
jgi:hypothetical protein